MTGADERNVTEPRDTHLDRREWISALMPLALLMVGAVIILGTTYWLLVVDGP